MVAFLSPEFFCLGIGFRRASGTFFCLNHRMILSLFLIGFYNQSLLSSLAVNSYIISCIFLRNVCCDFFLSGVPKFCFYAEQISGNLSILQLTNFSLGNFFLDLSHQRCNCGVKLPFFTMWKLVLLQLKYDLFTHMNNLLGGWFHLLPGGYAGGAKTFSQLERLFH